MEEELTVQVWISRPLQRVLQVKVLCAVASIPSRLFREITTSRSTPRISPSLFTSAESFVGKTATWSPDSYLK